MVCVRLTAFKMFNCALTNILREVLSRISQIYLNWISIVWNVKSAIFFVMFWHCYMAVWYTIIVCEKFKYQIWFVPFLYFAMSCDVFEVVKQNEFKTSDQAFLDWCTQENNLNYPPPWLSTQSKFMYAFLGIFINHVSFGYTICILSWGWS